MKKKNPRHRPVTKADIDRAIATTASDITDNALLMVFHVLADKTDLTPEDLYRVFQEVNKLAEEIYEGRVTYSDIRKVMREEYGIEFQKGRI